MSRDIRFFTISRSDVPHLDEKNFFSTSVAVKINSWFDEHKDQLRANRRQTKKILAFVRQFAQIFIVTSVLKILSEHSK